jgi:hypothetical protein
VPKIKLGHCRNFGGLDIFEQSSFFKGQSLVDWSHAPEPEDVANAMAYGADQILSCAKILDAGVKDLVGAYILTFHAIELGLKAFLIKKGFSEVMLKSKEYGHNLVTLYSAAKTHGLTLTYPDVEDMLTWINASHLTTMIRYQFLESPLLPHCATLFPLAHAVIKASKLTDAQRS